MKEKKDKKKLPLAVRLLLLPFKIILLLIVILLIWFTFCFFDRVKPADALPPDYALYLRTDSVWGTAEPLLDLDATLIAMSSPELQQYRDTFLQIKSSKLRKNFFVKRALKRRLDAAVYDDETGNAGALVVLDAGFLSGAVRLAPYAVPYIKAVSNIVELSSNRHGNYYQLQSGTPGFFVIKKNLIVFSTSRALLEEAMTWSNTSLYPQNELSLVNTKLKEPLRILANGQNLLKLFAENTEEDAEGAKEDSSLVKNYLEAIVPYLSQNEYTSLNFGITEKELNLSIAVPMDLSMAGEETAQMEAEQPVLKLLKKESAVPSLLPQFSDEVQYYTLISAGTLHDLKDAAIKILPAEKDFSATWNKSDTICKIVFNTSLDDVLFSWTGDEFAIFGIEGKSEPVIAIKIADETKRRQIFDRVFASFIVRSDDSLLVDGIRLPCIDMPGFMLSVLQALNS